MENNFENKLQEYASYARFFGGSLLLLAYTAFLVTIGYAVAGLLWIEPFRLGRAPGSYWGMILYDEVALKAILPFSGLGVVALIARPFLRRGKPLAAPLKMLTGLLLALVVAAWVIIGLNSFKGNGYYHQSSLNANGNVYHAAKQRVSLPGANSDFNYLVYRCDQIGLNCTKIYTNHFDGVYRFNQQGVNLHYETDNKRLKIYVKEYNKTDYVNIS
jgi:hypothetical protein